MFLFGTTHQFCIWWTLYYSMRNCTSVGWTRIAMLLWSSFGGSFFRACIWWLLKMFHFGVQLKKIAEYGFWIIRGWENNDNVLYLGLYLGIFYIFKRMTMDIYIFKHFHSENAALWKTEMSGSQNKVLLINYVNHSSNLTGHQLNDFTKCYNRSKQTSD